MTWAIDEKGYSQRRACARIGIELKTYRYVTSRGDDSEFRERLHRLAADRRRFGYRRLHILLRRVAAPAVEPIQFAPVAIVFRTAGEDGVTAAGASPSMRRGFAGNEFRLSRRQSEGDFGDDGSEVGSGERS